MILCLADDITGLTEIACMAVARGISCWTCFDYSIGEPVPCAGGRPADILAVNLACRTFPAEAAHACVDAAIHRFRRDNPDGRIYLKVDSAARGPIAAMLAAMAAFNFESPLPVLFANPATSRGVFESQLLVDGIPLHETPFRDDPIHPALTTDLRQILELPDPPGEFGPLVLDGATDADVAAQAARWSGAGMAAGAAPFGGALFGHWAEATPASAPPPSGFSPAPLHHLLAVVGSRHPNARQLRDAFAAASLGVHDLREAGSIARLPALIHAEDILAPPALIVEQLAAAAAAVLKRLPCDALYLTGGETAQTVLRTLGISGAVPLGSIGGMAELEAGHPHPSGSAEKLRLFLQPGSYINREIIDLLKIDTEE